MMIMIDMTKMGFHDLIISYHIIISTDLKLENILFVHNSLITIDVHRNGRNIRLSVPQKIRIKLIDFGGATYENEARASRIINTRQYRGPEVILELGNIND